MDSDLDDRLAPRGLGSWLGLSLALIAVCTVAQAKFIGPDIEQVPVSRLVTNLEAQVLADPQNVQAHYALARVHAMAYALKEGQLPVDRRSGKPFVASGPGGEYQLPRVVEVGDAAIHAKAREHLAKAVVHYRRAVELQKDHLPAQVGLAWVLEQQGERQDAIEAYRRALTLAWAKEKPQDHIFHSSITEEVADQLLALLRPDTDAEEIKRIKGYVSEIEKKPRAITPILIPIGPETDLDSLVDPAARVAFDLDGTQLDRRWGWITPKAAWLVSDPHHTGSVTSGLQMFGAVTFWVFWSNGYEALTALDDNRNGEIDGAELEGLALWRDANSNGWSDAGEVVPVKSYGIRSISCKSQSHPTGIPFNPRGVVFEDDRFRPSYDWVVRDLGRADGGPSAAEHSRE